MRLLFALVLVMIPAVFTYGQAPVDCDKLQVVSPRLKLTFEGLVDFVTPGMTWGSQPWARSDQAWIVAPNAKVPSNLPVKGNGEIGVHVANVVFDPADFKSSPTAAVALYGRHVEIEVEGQLPFGVFQYRENIPPHQTLPVAANTNRCSLEWLADINALSPRSRVKDEVVQGSAAPLAFRIRLDEGYVLTNSFIVADNKVCSIQLGNENRAMAESFSVLVPLGEKRTLTLKSTNFDGTDPVLHRFVLENDSAEIKIGYHTKNPNKDFRGHFALRSDWDQDYPPIPGRCATNVSPSSNPQCSPGDNSWP